KNLCFSFLKRFLFTDQKTLALGVDTHLYGWKLFGFESYGFAAMGKVFIPRNIVMFAFMAVYHFVRLYLGLIYDVVYINKNKKSNHGD
ncbi:MAG: hypothetical protein OEV45_14600, partial [Desulfobacteraceae bacterium]|nr:hypothetical protein [Desulfobacteraceae bacterium]